MTKTGKRKSSGATRAALRSPGRPPVGRREDRCCFWAAIARGLYPEAAVAAARVSWVVGRRGTMVPTWGRYAAHTPRPVRAAAVGPLPLVR